MGRLQVAEGVAFRVIAGQTILFSEADQAVLELNDTAAFIWRRLQDGAESEAIAADLAGGGADPETAGQFVRQALCEWERLQLIHNGGHNGGAGPAGSVGRPGAFRRSVEIGGMAAEIRSPPGPLTDQLSVLLQTFPEAARRPRLRLEVLERNGRFRLLRNGRPLPWRAAEEIAPLVREALTDELLHHGAYQLALHAAVLVHDGQALLVTGEPGAGKTTLALALVHAGFGFAGDDTALLDAEGRVAGVPFAATLKAGGWRNAARYRSDVMGSPVAVRPDGVRLRYLPAASHAPGALPVGWVVALDRKRRGAAALTPLSPADALRELLAGAFTPDERLSKAGFDALTKLLKGARSVRLTYSSADDAVARIREICTCPKTSPR